MKRSSSTWKRPTLGAVIEEPCAAAAVCRRWASRRGAHAPRVPVPGTRSDRVSVAVPDRDARHRHHAPQLQELRSARRTASLARQRRADRAGQRRDQHLWPLYLQERGSLFLGPGIKVYGGQIIGLHSRDNDLVVNPSKAKKLTNIRTTAADEKLFLSPPREFSLEAALEFINDDELVEVTPAALRLRKRFLDANERKRIEKVQGTR